jgi:hypothetical protein
MRILILTAAAFGLAGLAHADPERDTTEITLEEEASVAEPAADVAAAADDADATGTTSQRTDRRHCLKYTGTRVRRPDSCIELPGHVHEQDALVMTGERDAAEALNRLDPSVTIRR